MRLEDFSYVLPPELIASAPVFPRDSCRLMVLDRATQTFQHQHFYDLPAFLRKGDVLIFNDSKVIPARLVFKHGAKKVELFLLRAVSDDQWLALCRPGKIFRVGDIFQLDAHLGFTVEEILEDGQRLVRFSRGGRELQAVLKELGKPPFPPYIKETKATFEDYQTVYAKEDGSVAAPTAGLHFTDELFERLKNKGVSVEFVTLHVGLGTFLPIKTADIQNHQMHREFYHLDEMTAKRLTAAWRAGRRLIAVGTTSVRVLETVFDPRRGFLPVTGETGIFIYPGYHWKVVQGLITNFHLPKSTLLLLTSAFAGKDFVFSAYQEAIAQKYRFYSFGDAMFIV